jgi:tetratricopeptide (TPR) repeat protein
VNSDTDIQKSLDPIILYRVDCEKGEGIEIAKEYNVRSYPTYILINKDGQAIDRWAGYSKDYFLKTLADALIDPTTIDTKKARYTIKPELRAAVVLGRYASATGESKEAVNYYKQAQSLKTDPAIDYNYQIFDNTLEGISKKLFTYDELSMAADNAVKASKSPLEIYQIASQMAGVARQSQKQSEIVKYLQTGLDATANSTEVDITKAHKTLMVDFSLLVKNDTATAVEYKKATMPDGWMGDANQLNGFAWWCFENMANLKEAEQLSRKSVELAKPGKEKAMNLDTLAEIVHARGNTIEAVEISKQACKEDPASKYYPSQVERFQKAMTEKK